MAEEEKPEDMTPYGASAAKEIHGKLNEAMKSIAKHSPKLEPDSGWHEHWGEVSKSLDAMMGDTEKRHGKTYKGCDPLSREEIEAKAEEMMDSEEGMKSEGVTDETEEVKSETMSATDASEGGSLRKEGEVDKPADDKPAPSTVEGGEWRKEQEDKEAKDKEEKAMKLYAAIKARNDRIEQRLYQAIAG